MIRNHGEAVYSGNSKKILINNIGFNFRLDEISASIGISQLSRIDKIIKEREDKALEIINGISKLEGLIPAKIRAKCRHTFYTLPIKIDKNKLGVNREPFAKALRSEGLPISEGYVKPLYKLPIFQKKICYGDKGYPFNLTKINYKKIKLPIVEKMHYKELLYFGICSFNLNKKDISNIIDIFKKVHDNREKI